MQPLAIDLYCGLGGWTEGLQAEGYRVVGFDCERHAYGEHAYPAQLVLQDVLTIHGRQFKAADLIVASPPCQEFSYMAMPWSLAKQKIREYESGARDVKQLTALFDACFRIQREASEAKGEYIPLVVENVKGAQRWVGRARWHFGSFYLWGDVPALMPIAMGRKTGGGSWFNIGSPGQKETARNPVHELSGVKHGGDCFNDPAWAGKQGGVKQHGSGPVWFDTGLATSSSKSQARKAASATIAKIPYVLARHVGAAWHPRGA